MPATLLSEPSPVTDSQPLRVASVCTVLPTTAAPHHGVFVRQRLDALHGLTELRVLQPMPWFPLLRPRDPRAADIGLAHRTPMFYIPGIGKRFDGSWLARSVLPVLGRWHREQPLDLIDAHFGFPEGVGCLEAARRLNVPLFITVRGSETEYLTMPGIAPRLRRALLACEGVIAVSHSLCDMLIARGIPEGKVTVVPNGIDRRLFRPGPRDEACRALAISPDRRYVVSVGKLSSRKNQKLLIDAFARLSRSTDTELVLLGEHNDSYGRSAQELAGRRGLGNRIRFTGPQPPGVVVQWLRAADVFALPTRREGCCNAVLEALACGVPVVSTRAGDNARYVHSGVTGFLTETDDPTALADALEAALRQDWDGCRIAAEVADYGWDSVAGAVERTFRERLGIANSGRSLN